MSPGRKRYCTQWTLGNISFRMRTVFVLNFRTANTFSIFTPQILVAWDVIHSSRMCTWITWLRADPTDHRSKGNGCSPRGPFPGPEMDLGEGVYPSGSLSSTFGACMCLHDKSWGERALNWCVLSYQAQDVGKFFWASTSDPKWLDEESDYYSI